MGEKAAPSLPARMNARSRGHGVTRRLAARLARSCSRRRSLGCLRPPGARIRYDRLARAPTRSSPSSAAEQQLCPTARAHLCMIRSLPSCAVSSSSSPFVLSGRKKQEKDACRSFGQRGCALARGLHAAYI